MRVRAPIRQDAEAVLAVMVARDLADIGRPDAELGDVLSDWELDGTDPAHDCFVAEDGDGTVIGYAAVDERGALVLVHPRAEGHGAGTALREAVERRAGERGEPVRQAVMASNTAAIDHLRAAGYRRRDVHERLAAPLAALVAPPGGGSSGVRRFDLEREGATMHALVETALTEGEGRAPEPVSRWLARTAKHVDPAFRLAIDRAGEPVAAALGERWDGGVGYVAAIAVARPARGRGHGRALLFGLADAFRMAGLQRIELSVASANRAARALYRSAGLTLEFRQERWVKG